MRAWISGVVAVSRQSVCERCGKRAAGSACGERSLNANGCASPSAGLSESQSIDPRATRGGVPVLSRPSSKPNDFSAELMPRALPSPTRPPSWRSSPVCMSARMKVPVVNTTARAASARGSDAGASSGTVCTHCAIASPRAFASIARASAPTRCAPGGMSTPHAAPSASTRISSTVPAKTSMFATAAICRCTSARYAYLSHCARGPRTAGPLLAFSTLNWMPDASAARPMIPPSASISRTIWPFASPPIAGLQLI